MEELTGSITNGELQIIDQRDPSNMRTIPCSQATKEDLIGYLWRLNIEPPNKNIGIAIKYGYINYKSVEITIRRNFKSYNFSQLTDEKISFLYAWNHYSKEELCEYLRYGLEDRKLLNTFSDSLSLEDSKDTENKTPYITITFPTINYRINPNTINSELIRTIIEDNPTDTEIKLELYGSEFQWIVDQEIPTNTEPEQVFQILNYFGSIRLRQEFLQGLKVRIINMVKRELRMRREDFFERHLDKVNWFTLSENSSLSSGFFRRHLDKVKWIPFSENTVLTEGFVEKYIDEFGWAALSRNPALTENFFNRHIDEGMWVDLADYSDEFVDDYFELIIDWSSLSENSTIPEDFFEQHLDKVNWLNLSENPTLTEHFIDMHYDMLIHTSISENPALSDDFFERHPNEINSPLGKNPSISEDFINRHLDKITIYQNAWLYLSGNPALSEDFFERHLDKVDWEQLSGNPAMSEDFFERHLDKVDWYILSRNPALSNDFVERYLDKVDWEQLSRNPSMSEDFFERHLDKVNWYELSRNGISNQLVWRTARSSQYYSFDKLIWNS